MRTVPGFAYQSRGPQTGHNFSVGRRRCGQIVEPIAAGPVLTIRISEEDPEPLVPGRVLE